MKSEDFIYLNVPGLMTRYSNPSPNWHDIVRALAQTQLTIFRQNLLINPDAEALNVPIDNAIVRFSDLTEIGQAFVRSGSIDRWLASCDRRNSIDAYRDVASLQGKFEKFSRERISGLA